VSLCASIEESRDTRENERPRSRRLSFDVVRDTLLSNQRLIKIGNLDHFRRERNVAQSRVSIGRSSVSGANSACLHETRTEQGKGKEGRRRKEDATDGDSRHKSSRVSASKRVRSARDSPVAV